MAADFTTLDGIFQMFQPSDLAGAPSPDLGGPLEKIGDDTNPFKQIVGLLENNGRGVLSITDIAAKINELKSKASTTGLDPSQLLQIWTEKTLIDIGDDSAKAKQATDNQGKTKTVDSLQQVIGPKFKIPEDVNVALVLSRTPYFSPMTRNTKKAEIFLNSMPTLVLSQLVPYMQVEFQFVRDPADQLQTLSQLKLLIGASNKVDLQGANQQMAKLQEIDDQEKQRKLSFVGMEAFTSPVTLTNPQPNKSVGSNGTRYTDVLDPFRPFASLQNVTINSKPSGAGYFCYKKATLSLKVHDRTRLAEISDLLRPRVYTGVTIWLTYGWRAPLRGSSKENPYFDYVNSNMMMREAYHIVNSSFSFDALGQVLINLELFTKGVHEMRDLKITSTSDDSEFKIREVQDLIEKISRYRQALRLDPPEGLNKEIRVFQILDAAETGEFPDMKPDEISKKITALNKALNQTDGIDKTAVSGLIDAMQKLYKPDNADKQKFDVKQRYETRAAARVEAMFTEVRTGDDPFLPSAGKGTGEDISKMCDQLNKPPSNPNPTKFFKTVVSFGKLFSVFALRGLVSIPESTGNEIQVFFYNLNSQCGPISQHSIAEFPIYMPQFLDAFNDMVKSRGGEKILLEDFVQLAINSQFLDNRAIGYGLRDYYEPYSKGKDAQVKKDQEGDFESKMAAFTSKYGPFKKPQVEIHIECSHQKLTDSGSSDILQLLTYSAADATVVDLPTQQAQAARKIFRIHVYDKQTNAYAAAQALLRNAQGTGFINVNKSLDGVFNQVVTGPDATRTQLIQSLGIALNEDVADGRITVTDLGSFTSNQQVKDVVGKMMPTIRFGSNGTTITSANLSSKADPLLSTVQMIRTQTIRNTAQPNGSGDLGLPLRVIPAALQLTTLGNPLATMAQQYFIDFQTGTTLDNLYICTGLTHTFTPGKFETNWQFGFADAYGVYEGAPNILQQLAKFNSAIPKDPAP